MIAVVRSGKNPTMPYWTIAWDHYHLDAWNIPVIIHHPDLWDYVQDGGWHSHQSFSWPHGMEAGMYAHQRFGSIWHFRWWGMGHFATNPRRDLRSASKDHSNTWDNPNTSVYLYSCGTSRDLRSWSDREDWFPGNRGLWSHIYCQIAQTISLGSARGYCWDISTIHMVSQTWTMDVCRISTTTFWIQEHQRMGRKSAVSISPHFGCSPCSLPYYGWLPNPFSGSITGLPIYPSRSSDNSLITHSSLTSDQCPHTHRSWGEGGLIFGIVSPIWSIRWKQLQRI